MPIDPMTIVFGLIALFVIWKLRSVLGEKTGLEKPPRDMFAKRQSTPPAQSNASSLGQNVVRLPGAATAPVADPNRWRGYAEPGSAVASGLDAIAAADPSFSAAPFVDGAKTAYEAIVTAFAAAERKTLQTLLAKDVYDSFNAAISAREAARETLSTTFVSVDDAKIETAHLEGRTARVSVRFLSKQISVTRGADGQITDGGPDRVIDMNDIWTFARETNARDPNWKLVATESGR